jgi:hypothetical protein
MTPERWQQVEQLLQAALECEPAERVALLERECATDPDLREEVESLLSSAQETDSFLNANAAADAAVFTHRRAVGRQFAREVALVLTPFKSSSAPVAWVKCSLAEDVRLGRKVALKLLESLTHERRPVAPALPSGSSPRRHARSPKHLHRPRSWRGQGRPFYCYAVRRR